MSQVAYANQALYKGTSYGGSLIPDAELDSYLAKASNSIDLLTSHKITQKGFDNMTSFQQGCVALATCYQADHLYQYGDVLSTNLDSYRNGDNTVKLGSNVDMRYSRSALDNLMPTGLLYRGL